MGNVWGGVLVSLQSCGVGALHWALSGMSTPSHLTQQACPPLLSALLDVAEREMYSYIASYFCLSIFLAYNNHLTRYIYSTINAHYTESS